ncbi:hypothetical protein AVKW3434_15475 [Acidovorax sp. SUPP3434]|uniref:hypothetical protein n=1 Tax=Acidovorax sp. SUPP3434 TaxID=2920880 RepID=UPI0023DE583A|nr:hypothetical protein [Acidovorax sp. SUPP3434]GKT00806.1 hypothetical protein AVKW3434_15475 [Acidovorax sp. SUPP3434]
MSYQEVLRNHVIVVSISESPDMGYLGLSERHLQDAMAEIARHLLALGARLSYGGDLRAGGFSELLFELVQRHRRDVEEDSPVGIKNFLAWPVHLRMPFAEIDRAAVELKGIADLVCLDENGTCMSLETRRQIQEREPSAAEWDDGLTAMRRAVRAESHAHIVLGGRVDNFKGSMPGIAEESILSLESNSPLFVLGGFGGCSRDIAETLGLADPWAPLNRAWRERATFAKFRPNSLNNGLTEAENRILAKTPHIDQAIILILKGLVGLDI